MNDSIDNVRVQKLSSNNVHPKQRDLNKNQMNRFIDKIILNAIQANLRFKITRGKESKVLQVFQDRHSFLFHYRSEDRNDGSIKEAADDLEVIKDMLWPEEE